MPHYTTGEEVEKSKGERQAEKTFCFNPTGEPSGSNLGGRLKTKKSVAPGIFGAYFFVHLLWIKLSRMIFPRS
jgi:hypothetical protein